MPHSTRMLQMAGMLCWTVDLMSSRPPQLTLFFDSNWNAVSFKQVSCSAATNPTPPVNSWGCMENCSNNDAGGVCLASTAQDDIIAASTEAKAEKVAVKSDTSGSKSNSVCSA